MSCTLDGATVALLTPLDENANIDEAALDRLLRRVLDGGVTGISPTGSTGEGARLSRAQRLEMTRLVRKLVPETTPVIPGLPLTSIAEGAEELAQQADQGASGALVAPPYYYPLSDEEARRLYLDLADRAALPLVLYNIPVFTKVKFAPTVVAELAEHPNIVGIKDSSRDIEYFQELAGRTENSDFSVITGSDTFFIACLLAGGVGTIAASANLVPQLPAGIYRAVQDGDIEKASQLERDLRRVIHICRVGNLPAAWKAALAHLDVIQPYLAAPAAPLPAVLREELVRELTAAGVS
ncbi:MAG: hypothetical protein GEV07_19865 [Streptosporangiales bacterium]|nr:hypothetical protein [Streptosporangiales bacterium]